MVRLLFLISLCLLLADANVKGETNTNINININTETETETETEVYLPSRKLAGIETDKTKKHGLVRGRNLTNKKRPSKSHSMKMEGGTPNTEDERDATSNKFTSTGTLGLEGDEDDLVDEKVLGEVASIFCDSLNELFLDLCSPGLPVCEGAELHPLDESSDSKSKSRRQLASGRYLITVSMRCGRSTGCQKRISGDSVGRRLTGSGGADSEDLYTDSLICKSEDKPRLPTTDEILTTTNKNLDDEEVDLTMTFFYENDPASESKSKGSRSVKSKGSKSMGSTRK